MKLIIISALVTLALARPQDSFQPQTRPAQPPYQPGLIGSDAVSPVQPIPYQVDREEQDGGHNDDEFMDMYENRGEIYDHDQYDHQDHHDHHDHMEHDEHNGMMEPQVAVPLGPFPIMPDMVDRVEESDTTDTVPERDADMMNQEMEEAERFKRQDLQEEEIEDSLEGHDHDHKHLKPLSHFVAILNRKRQEAEETENNDGDVTTVSPMLEGIEDTAYEPQNMDLMRPFVQHEMPQVEEDHNVAKRQYEDLFQPDPEDVPPVPQVEENPNFHDTPSFAPNPPVFNVQPEEPVATGEQNYNQEPVNESVYEPPSVVYKEDIQTEPSEEEYQPSK